MFFKRALPSPVLGLHFTRRGSGTHLCCGPANAHPFLLCTGPQILMIAVFTLTGILVVLLLIALLVLRYLLPTGLPSRWGREKGTSLVSIGGA